MMKFARMVVVAGGLMLAPLGRAQAGTYAVVFNQSGGQIAVSNDQYHMTPNNGTATWTWLDFTINSGARGWHVTDTGMKCGTGWVIRAQSKAGGYNDACLEIPWGQVGCVGIAIESTGLKMAQIPWQACSNSWWEQAGSPAFMQVFQAVLQIASSLG